MAKKQSSGPTIVEYKVLAGLDTSDEKRFEADTIIKASDLLPLDLNAYLEMGVIELYTAPSDDEQDSE